MTRNEMWAVAWVVLLAGVLLLDRYVWPRVDGWLRRRFDQ